MNDFIDNNKPWAKPVQAASNASSIFNPEDRIANVGGAAVYLRVIEMFIANQRTAITAVQQALAIDDQKTAERTAHTLKGVALTIGAPVLAETARQLEKAIKENEVAQYPALIEATATALAQVLVLAEAYLKEHAAPRQQNQPGDFDPAVFSKLLQLLIQQLRSFDCESENTVQQIIQQAKDSAMAERFTLIQRQIRGYDYENALESVQPLAKSLAN